MAANAPETMRGQEHRSPSTPAAWRRRIASPVFVVFLGFAAVGLFYLLTAHPAHVLDYLPFALLLLCPFLHLLGGHGSHGGHADTPPRTNDHQEVHR